MHLGMIGGIGPAATVYYYEQLVAIFAERNRPLELTIGNSSVKMLTDNLVAENPQAQALEFKRIADNLAAAGAERIIVSSMGGHFCIKEFAAISPLQPIEGPPAVRKYLIEKGVARPGILGTRKVMETGLYGELAELEPVIPRGEDLAQANADYVAIATSGAATAEQSTRLLKAGEKLIEEQGADVVLLGGTDLSIVYDRTCDLPFIDTAQVHVEAIASLALED